eukprot:g581.t1
MAQEYFRNHGSAFQESQQGVAVQRSRYYAGVFDHFREDRYRPCTVRIGGRQQPGSATDNEICFFCETYAGAYHKNTRNLRMDWCAKNDEANPNGIGTITHDPEQNVAYILSSNDPQFDKWVDCTDEFCNSGKGRAIEFRPLKADHQLDANRCDMDLHNRAQPNQ